MKNLADGRELAPKQLEEILTLLESLDKYATFIRRQGGDFGDYVEKRSKKGTFPVFIIKVREGNDETVHYFDNLATQKFKDKNSDLYDAEAKEKSEKPKNQTRRAVRGRICIWRAARSSPTCSANFPRRDWPWIITPRRTKPLYELIEGEGDKTSVTPLAVFNPGNLEQRESRRQKRHPNDTFQRLGRNGCEGTF